MASFNKRYGCPECEKEHITTFDFHAPDDGDEDCQTIECCCGCEFNVSCEIHVDYDFSPTHPIVTKSGIKKVEFDINDTSTWRQENNPNQLTIPGC